MGWDKIFDGIFLLLDQNKTYSAHMNLFNNLLQVHSLNYMYLTITVNESKMYHDNF